MRGKINELLFIKGTVVLPFFFRKKNLNETKYSIYRNRPPVFSTDGSCLDRARRNKATNSCTSTDLFQLERKAMSLANYSRLLDLLALSHWQL